MSLADNSRQSLHLGWPICEAPAGTNAATYQCVPAEQRGYLLQLSGVHLERQLIQGGEGCWRRLASSLIPPATNSIICSVLVSVSLSPSPSSAIPLSPASLHLPPSTFCPFSSTNDCFFFVVMRDRSFPLFDIYISYFMRAQFSHGGKKKKYVLCLILEFVAQC